MPTRARRWRSFPPGNGEATKFVAKITQHEVSVWHKRDICAILWERYLELQAKDIVTLL
jgi:hypothetical protein